MYFIFGSERELADEEEDLYDSVPEAEDGIYGSVIDFKPTKTLPKVSSSIKNSAMWNLELRSYA